MTCEKEEKFQIAGFGTCPVIFHRFSDNRCGVSVWNNHKLTHFAETPWLANKLAFVHAEKPFRLPKVTAMKTAKLALSIVNASVQTALEALEHQDVLLMAEAISSIYGLQKMAGAPTLPHRREVAKRHVTQGAVYLFGDYVPKAIRANADVRVL